MEYMPGGTLKDLIEREAPNIAVTVGAVVLTFSVLRAALSG